MKNKLYFLCIQDYQGKILKITSSHLYDQLLQAGMSSSTPEVKNTFWTIVDEHGTYIDGNFPTHD